MTSIINFAGIGILFLIVLVVIIIAVAVGRGAKGSFNISSKTNSVVATVSLKDKDGKHVVFQLADGGKIELKVKNGFYEMFKENERVKISYQGEKLYSCEKFT